MAATTHVQRELLDKDRLFQQTVRTKLSGLASGNWWLNFCRCGNELVFRQCQNCSEVETFKYQCSNRWCPTCGWRVVEARKRELEFVTTCISQPKHLVLTQRNFEVLNRRTIVASRKNLLKLRRKKLMGGVRGGCASLEFTNESRGWHMHWHLLLDVDWIDAGELSKRWGQLVHHDRAPAIVKLLDVRGKSYVQEVAKYLVKGSELARWQPEMILEFIRASRSTRAFTSFGTFNEYRREFRRARAANRVNSKPVCDCGCNRFEFRDREHATTHMLWSQSREIIGALKLPQREQQAGQF